MMGWETANLANGSAALFDGARRPSIVAPLSESISIMNGPLNPAWIGLFDILGFESLNDSIPGEELAVILESIPARLEQRLAWTPDEQHVGVTMYSDSILVYAGGQSNLGGLITASAGLIAVCASQGIPLRGAITKGEFFLTPIWTSGSGVSWGQQTWGKALIRAYHLERAQDWVGAILDPDCPTTPEDEAELQDAKDGSHLVAYQAPIKAHEAWRLKGRPLVVNWTKQWGSSPETILDRIRHLGAMKDRPSQKLDATAAFYRWATQQAASRPR